MALRINGMGGKYIVPNVLSRKYRFTAFTSATITFKLTSKNGKTEVKSVNAKKKIREAWNFITKVAAAHKPCNNYFKKLRRKKTLKEVLAEGAITLHCLDPKPPTFRNSKVYTYEDLPDAVTSGRDIGINPLIILLDSVHKLSAVLIHEIAHIAGASTNPDSKDPKSRAAEKALLHCKCGKQYRKDVVGMKSMPKIRIQKPGESRMA